MKVQVHVLVQSEIFVSEPFNVDQGSQVPRLFDLPVVSEARPPGTSGPAAQLRNPYDEIVLQSNTLGPVMIRKSAVGAWWIAKA